ncbi:DinB family protein [Paenibacillus pasadenensis]|uniref:DinB-like domain-containing protein n=1 Tax=Paenibacillus pasadenensis TaxID=217090 RepID=A0A2N5N9V5_9BACL|nr:DinB family protein [Paenibacillus pasadenensis]PLT47141.1 hypothetical protein B8V81_1365 [Paenibacillus pasadenensis]
MQTRHEVLFNQLEAYRSELLELAEAAGEDAADRIPDGFANNIRWNLGHVFTDQYLWIRALTKEEVPLPPGFPAWFGYGTNPSLFTAETPSYGQLLELLRQQPLQLRERYGDRLEESYPPTEMGMHTIEQVLVRTIFHEGLHIGAVQAIRRQLNRQAANAG